MKKTLFLALLFFSFIVAGQDLAVSGNIEINSQLYNKDTIIDAPEVPEKFLTNIYAQINFNYKNFTAGFRYEAYQNALLGYDRRYNGQGLANKFVEYRNDFVTVTAGNFYEQFGNGLVLRSFEDRSLGYDNSFSGGRIILKPIDGIRLKALIGRQRFFWTLGDGIVRAFDAEANVNTALGLNMKPDITIGGSFVSKYQKDENPIFILPENVAAFAARTNVYYKNISLNAEYAYKINDPSADNDYIYKPGQAAYFSISYSKSGMGLIISADRYDNMSFRSDRNATVNSLYINSVPTITPINTYALETIYPYAVHPTDEMGLSGELFYKIKKKSKIGGKYGTLLSLNFVSIRTIDKTAVFDGTGYESSFFEVGKQLYYQELGVKLEHKFSRRFKLKTKYLNFIYNKDLVQGLMGYGTVYGNIGVVDMRYKFSSRKSLRTEIQALFTEQDMGNWTMIFAEYSVAPHWYFSAYDQYNYGNPHPDKRIHYYDLSIAYVKESTRISLSYGRHREGIICVGGVCRNVPASNGASLSFSTTF